MFLVYILLSNGAFLDFLSIYALLSQKIYVEIYALFPQIFCHWKADSANFSAFRMYGGHSVQTSCQTEPKYLVSFVEKQECGLDTRNYK